MPLAVQYALIQSDDIEQSCREVANQYINMQDVNKIRKHEFEISEMDLDKRIDDLVVEIASQNQEKLIDEIPTEKSIGYFKIDSVQNEVGINVRHNDRKWQDVFPVINTNTGEEEVVKSSRDEAIEYAEFRAQQTSNTYEIHIEKIDKFNTSLEAEVGPNVVEDNAGSYILFWLTETQNDDFDLGNFRNYQ